jgi:hypothetical protein
MSEVFYSGPQPGGAGTEIVARDGSAQTRQRVRGVVVAVGPAQKGAANRPLPHGDEGGLMRRIGRHLKGTWLWEASRAFLAQARGTGQLYTSRVVANTDIGEPTGVVRVYDRNVDCGYHSAIRAGKLRNIAFDCDAATAGEWAGPAYFFGGKVSNDTSAISGQDFATGYSGTWLADELVGATFELQGLSKQFKILGNTAAGVLNLDGGFTEYTSSGSAKTFQITRANTDASGQPMELGIVVSDDPTRPLNDFALAPVLDRAQVLKQYTGLSMLDTAAIEQLIESELAGTGPNEELALDFTVSEISDESLPQSRPANWVGIPVPAAVTAASGLKKPVVTNSKTVQFKIMDFIRRSGSGAITIDRSTVSYGAKMIPHRLILTFTNTSDFTITAEDLNGKSIALGLPNGAKGTAWTSPHPHLASFTVASGSSPVAADVWVLEFRPFPADLAQRNARLYVSAWAAAGTGTLDPTKSYVVIGSTADTLTLATTDDLTTQFEAPQPPSGIGTLGGPFDMSGTAKALTYTQTINGVAGSTKTLTSALSGASETLAAVIADLNTQAAAGDEDIEFYNSDNKIAWWSKAGEYGADVSITFGGTWRSIAGLPSTAQTGRDGAPARLEYIEPMRNARPEHDGITELDYTSGPLAISDANPLAALIKATPGLVHVMIPGQTSAALHQALINFCAAYGAVAVLDLPDGGTITTEEGAAKWVRDNISPNRFAQYAWPAWGYTPESAETPNKLRKLPLSGDLLGAMVRYCNSPSRTTGLGWHKAPGGLGNVALSPRIRRLDTGVPFSGTQTRIRDHVLNNAGILPVMADGAAIYVHGDQGANSGFLGTFWLHKQKAFLDIIQTLNAGQFADLEYEANVGGEGSTLQTLIEAKIVQILELFWRDGALDILEDGLPVAFESAYKVDAGPSLNPVAVRDQGRRVANVEFRIVNTTKRIQLNLFTTGIAVPPTAA